MSGENIAAVWENGLPTNLSASACDALAWLLWLQKARLNPPMLNEDKARLGQAIDLLQKNLTGLVAESYLTQSCQEAQKVVGQNQ